VQRPCACENAQNIEGVSVQLRRSVDHPSQSLEEPLHLAFVLQPITRLPARGVVPHHIRAPEFGQMNADPRDMAPDQFGELARRRRASCVEENDQLIPWRRNSVSESCLAIAFNLQLLRSLRTSGPGAAPLLRKL
jgi:hypothetical protein